MELPANVGLKGKGLSGVMDLDDTHFVAEGIPLTEFRDSDYEANPSAPSPYPYQFATVTVWNAATGAKLAETISVAPVSTEMHCDNCQSDGQHEGIATGSVELNILTLHDRQNMSEYPFGHTGPLVNRAPILCAECHASNALGEPGQPEIPSLSNAMHTDIKRKLNPRSSEAVRGQKDSTVITATSLFDSSLVRTVTDTTIVPKYFIYLPLVIRLF